MLSIKPAGNNLRLLNASTGEEVLFHREAPFLLLMVVDSDAKCGSATLSSRFVLHCGRRDNR